MDLIPTGITGLDELIYGGFVRGNSVLVEGVPGAGKTTFGIEFIYRGITEFSEPGVIVTFEELPESMYRDALNFGWDLRSLERENKLRVLCTSPELLLDTEINLVEEIVSEIGARRILIDSISHFRHVVEDVFSLRKTVYSFCSGLRRMNLTSVLVKERETEGDHEYAFEEYVVDAVIHLENKERPGLQRHRMLEITKTRGQDHIPGKHTFRITTKGIKIFAPVSIVHTHNEPGGSDQLLHTGIPGLDELLRGGLPRNITVSVPGGSGTGKTLFGLQFLVKGAQDYQEKGIFISMEAPPSQLLSTARRFSWDLPRLQKEGLVWLVYKPLCEMEIDETIIWLGEVVKEFGARRLVLDSIYGFLSRLDNIAVLHEKFYYLVNYLNNLNCNTLLICPTREMTGDKKMDIIYSLVQGTIILRFDFLQRRRVRQLEIYKMPGINHCMGNHLVEINGSGLKVFPRAGG